MKGRRWFANDDIPINILSRLSTKELHLLKMVSKDWHNLISDRSLISLQLKRTEPAPVSGFFFQEVFEWSDNDDTKSIRYIPAVDVERVNVRSNVLDFLSDNVVILSLNNGLLCCRSSFPNSQPMIYVCNPLNKQWRSIMWPNLPKDCSIALAFDPSQDPIDISTDFKLVAVSRIEDEGEEEEDQDDDEEEEEVKHSFNVYSSKTRSWTRLKECFRCNDLLTRSRGVLANGVLYWLIDCFEVVVFDHRNGMPWSIAGPLPPSEFTDNPHIYMCIGESQGKLHCVLVSEHGLLLWVLEDQFTPKWALEFCASLEELERENSNVLFSIEEKVMVPLSFKDGVVLLSFSNGVYLYQFDTRKMKKLCDVSSLVMKKAMFHPIVVPYTMSLVPVEQA